MQTIFDRISGKKPKEDDVLQLHLEKSDLYAKKAAQKPLGTAAAAFPVKAKTDTSILNIGSARIPISDITGSRGLVSQNKGTQNDETITQGTGNPKAPYIPISVVTGSRDITTVSPELRAYLLKGSPSATIAMPEEYAELANLLNKTGSTIDFRTGRIRRRSSN